MGRKRSWTLWLAGLFLVLLYAAVWVVPLFWDGHPNRPDPAHTLTAPSAQHLLGTDELGRDVLARLLAGGRITLSVAVMAMVVALVIGVTVGALAGYFRGWVESLLMRLVDAIMAIPSFFLILTLLTIFGHSTPMVILVIGVNYWTPVARMVYAEFLRFREREFVEASRAAGAHSWTIIVRHILPQVIPSLIVLLTLGIGWSILAESGLSYLGLGIQPPQASWGNMLQNAQVYIWTAPRLAIYPGLAIMATVLAFNALGNALRDQLDPRK
ncbi:MAG: ABC transporter permease [Bacillota bacterium]|nr:ABC transporter permease [Bacillota bacterium]